MMRAKPRIRSFERDDQVMARQLILRGLGEHFGCIDESRNPDVDDIAAHYVTPGHVFLVAEAGPQLVGTAALVLESERAGQLVRISVASEHRRQGIGRTLVEELIRIAQQRGLARLWVETNDDWEDAIGFYRSCGFQEYDRTGGSVYMVLKLSCNQSGCGA